MGADRYEVLIRPDRPGEEILKEIERQDLDFQQIFYDFICATNSYGWDQREHLETLDDRFQTYVLPVGGDRNHHVMMTREVGHNRYYYLGLTTAELGKPAKEAVYRNACEAHSLSNPQRVQNPTPS